MTNLQILTAYYGERGYKQYNIYRNENVYSLRTNNDTYKHNYIYINNKEELIEDIIFSIEMHYYNKLLLVNSDSEFITKFKLYQIDINILCSKIFDIYLMNEKYKKSCNDNIHILINKEINDIIYETDFTGSKKLGIYMLNIENYMVDNIDIKTILFDVYNYELSQINNKLINIDININNELLELKQDRIIPFITNDEIINIILNNRILTDLQNVLMHKIYEFINYNIHNETILIKLYNCLQIKYLKFIIDDNPKLLWCMKKLNVLYNVYIPIDYVDKYMLIFINNYNDHIIHIKYNTDNSDITKLNTLLVDQLYLRLTNIK